MRFLEARQWPGQAHLLPKQFQNFGQGADTTKFSAKASSWGILRQLR